MSPMRTTKELIAAARAGEPEAKNELVRRHSDALDRHLRLRIGAHLRARVEIEDVFQETLARAFESLDSFRWQGEGSFLRWLLSIAENQILALAKKYRREEVLLVEDRQPAAQVDSPSASLTGRIRRSSALLSGFLQRIHRCRPPVSLTPPGHP
ncbi:MAG: hypothetical protein HY717_23210 [Planctomycetes bacterium]|nr:hypothetical protein [Planctomycetota bacterium]